MRRAALPLLILGCAAALIGWNAGRFAGRERTVRTKDLSFLPAPEVARALVGGHANTAARLRWIDSFAYLQLQFDRKDDTVAGGGSGFARLYDTLIALDPHYQPFYEHAALALGGIVDRHDRELAYLQRGLFAMPHASDLWRIAAAVLVSEFRWDERQPGAFDAFLAAWADSETSDAGRQVVWRWQQMLGRRKFVDGLEQLPYWLDRLPTTKPGTALGDYVEGIVREQVALYGGSLLTAAARRRNAAGRLVLGVQQLADPALWREVRVDPRFAPLAAVDGRLVLKPDPYGYDWDLRDGLVVSPGFAFQRFAKALDTLSARIARVAADQGRWPETLDEVRAAGVTVPEPPAGATIVYRDRRLVAELPPPPHPPLALR